MGETLWQVGTTYTIETSVGVGPAIILQCEQNFLGGGEGLSWATGTVARTQSSSEGVEFDGEHESMKRKWVGGVLTHMIFGGT